MGLQLRITYQDKDYVYEILNNTSITKFTSELEIQLNGEKFTLQKDDRKVWVQKGGEKMIDPEFAQALGRSVSLRYRM
jgi:hypothetical protein